MVDWFDRAQAQEQRERDKAIAAQLASPRPSGPSRTHCLVCEEPILEKRRALGGIVRCTPCESLSEQGKRR
ncbi:conjugal transfer protein TraR [Pseudomonas sp. HLS-6]|uniref:TraR/DksA C4-type zinc finger protein n=1 Tax=Pseudomonas sp. HLS-6 TaxID=2049589 RepID=UPI000C1768EB|nr:TraR/DksA C4-type zinc finger protein [Pseudomonas sp. HLS-6]ATR85182.1 conjugal transfer protein TraR [Pseudomonas sp. HLS-6]